jgi:intergrase/recombinase
MVLSWPETKKGFLEYVRYKRYSEGHAKAMVSHMDRFVDVIRGPLDVMRVFAPLSRGQRHQLIRGMRAWFNYLELSGQASEWFLNLLRKAVPKDESGIDLKVPTEEDIVRSLRLMREHSNGKYFALYNLTLDSGLRLVEAVKVVNMIQMQGVKPEGHDGFYVIPIGEFRKCKLSYFGFFTEYTMRLIERVKEEVNDRFATGYLTSKGKRNPRRAVVTWKYLRKFAFDTMTDEELNIPESVADFIQGRTPKSIGARHYMKLKRKAIKFYPRYAEYIARLREKALN